MRRLTNIFTRRGWFAMVGLPVAVALGAGSAAGTMPSPLLVNESPSLPRGLYWRAFGDQPRPGTIVAVKQPAAGRSYLGALGFPAELSLLKRVVAVSGQPVCVGDGVVETPAGRFPVLVSDRRGRRLPVWSGCRRLRAGEVFVLGDTESSFDSRYFGPVSRSDILGVYREGLSW